MNNSNKIILDLCGGTGAWSKPYKDNGYDVRLITLPDNDVRTYIPPQYVYGILAAPPCQMFSFCRTSPKNPRDLRMAMETVYACLKIIWECQYDVSKLSIACKKTTLKFWALENPYFGLLKNFIGKSAFVFDPWEFGDMYKKRTALWGNFNEPHKLYKNENGRMKKFDRLLLYKLKDLRKPVNEFGLIENRQELRSITPPRFAQAFCEANK